MNCDPIARCYRWLEYAGFGRGLERRREAFVKDVADARRALVLGDGDGRFLVKLVEQNSGASIDYVDLSARMLELARTRAGDRVTYRQGDARTIPLPRAEYDLIVTHFFLDCFDERDATKVVDRVARSAGTNARWIISEFRQPERGFAALWARAWLAFLYWFFRMTTRLETRMLVDHRPLLERSGFSLEKEERGRWGLVYSELWTKLS